ncbi:hypothetical protein FPZ12_031510 [Amycolatopsis acidicola]|uniref:DUF6292 domain-containing protein n=1 Tax=Amycolatopsis acidicola TaxID=2596893 RepID=A0A5N0UVZ4_9PSEU|nr:DUF6292 family protein [Amycolatopsis acidicola]KAA9154705.1 hypothetical protein FPZ12_031510 [Amycolatopsis acidicola]
MDIYGWDAAESALRAYIAVTAKALGVPPDSTCCTMGRPATGYIALDDRLPGFPDRDLALLWEDTRGWAAAIETHCGEDLIVVSYLGVDPVPAPHQVAGFVKDLLADAQPGSITPPEFPVTPDLLRRLAAFGYTGTHHWMTTRSSS